MNKARSPSFLSQCARLLGITDDEYFLCIRSGDVGNGRVAAGGLYQKTSTRGQVRRDGDMNIGLGLVDVDDVTGAKANVLVLDEVQIAYHLNGPLDEREFKAYSSTKLKDERLAVYTFTILLTNFDNLTLGVGVHFRQSDEVWIGTLRWKSYLPEQREWYTVQYEKLTVGIELSPEYAGKGNSDGEFEGKRYFSCEKDRAIFVPFYSAKVARQGGKVKSTMTSPAIETDSTSYITSDRDVMNVLNNAYRQPVTTTSISHGSDRKQKVRECAT